MAVAATIISQNAQGTSVEVTGTLAFSGNYVTDGEVPTFPGLRSSKAIADDIRIEGIAGYKYEYNYANGKVLVRQSAAASNPMSQLSAAAYPAGVTGDTVRFRASFKKF